jgi:hypothetical protein
MFLCHDFALRSLLTHNLSVLPTPWSIYFVRLFVCTKQLENSETDFLENLMLARFTIICHILVFQFWFKQSSLKITNISH